MFKKLFGFGKKEEEPEKVEEVVEASEEESAPEVSETEENSEEDTEQTNDEEISTEANEEAPEEAQAETKEEETEDRVDSELGVESDANDVLIDETVPVQDGVDEIQEDIVEDVIEEVVEETPKKKSFFGKLMDGLNKTRKGITDQIDNLLNNYGEIDDDLFDELEEILIMADVGMNTTMKIIDELRDELKARKINDSSLVKDVLHDVVESFLTDDYDSELKIDPSPAIVLVIGVNGAGKTTSIGKMAHKFKSEGKTVLMAAADTFRAAAIDQLKVWGDRVDVNVIAHTEGSDPAAVIFDGIQAAKARNVDVLICDTAGRLHNKKNLMNELAKIFKVIEREYPQATREVLLVLDATTGQNAIQQAKLFKETAAISGIVLTKLDGTAKGGVVLAVNDELSIPVKMIGVGEGMEDLQTFDPKSFVKALMDV